MLFLAYYAILSPYSKMQWSISKVMCVLQKYAPNPFTCKHEKIVIIIRFIINNAVMIIRLYSAVKFCNL